uniref:Paired domain-containing protein n=1 Tax=Salarias fasciatus TaxID=181472 RepID=A0A672J0X5_SALFA
SRRRRLPEDQGARCGSEGAIGQELRMPKSTVHSIIVKYRLSNTVENLPRGEKRKISLSGRNEYSRRGNLTEALTWRTR